MRRPTRQNYSLSKRDYDDLLVGVGCADLDTFRGADDDAKLAAALSYAAAQTHIPTIRFPARDVTLNEGGLLPFSGMKWCGPYGSDGPKNIALSSGSLVTHKVIVNVGSGVNSLFNGAPATDHYYDVQIRDLAFRSENTTSQFWHQPGGVHGLYAGQFHSLTFENFLAVLGNYVDSFTMTQMMFTGHWTCLGGYDTQFHLGGSDNTLWMDAMLNLGAERTPGPGIYLIKWNAISKTNVGYIYATVYPGWKAMRCKNDGGVGNASFFGGTYEGWPALPATQPLIDVDEPGGATTGSWAFFGTRFNYVNSASQGVIVQSGGRLRLYAPAYKRYSGKAESFPLLYQTGGRASIYDSVAVVAGENPYARWADGTVTKLVHPNGIQSTVRTKVSVTSATTLDADPGTDYVVFVGSGGAPTLPAAATAAAGANMYTLNNVHTTAVTVACNGAETINGSTTVSLPPQASLDLYSDGTNWRIT